MKHSITAFLLALAVASPALAQDPTLVGTWKGEFNGIGVAGDTQSGTATWVITEQNGRGFRGHTRHNDAGGAHADDEFVGVIAADDRGIKTADKDGFTDGHFVDPNTIDLCYTEIGADRKVSCGRLVRQP